MQIELREDSVLISGYVNAVERYSKPIHERNKGTFIEKIKAGAFKSALERNDNVLILLNHDFNKRLADTKSGSAKLEEDNIGLRAEVEVTDADVVQKARNNQLVGWSFGFYSNADEAGREGIQETRTITDMDLVEVSILDNTKRPAYYGTSISARTEGEKLLEFRDEVEEMDADGFADIITCKVAEKLSQRVATDEETAEEPTTEEEPKAEEEPEAEAPEEIRAETVDYSEYEARIAKLKKED